MGQAYAGALSQETARRLTESTAGDPDLVVVIFMAAVELRLDELAVRVPEEQYMDVIGQVRDRALGYLDHLEVRDGA